MTSNRRSLWFRLLGAVSQPILSSTLIESPEFSKIDLGHDSSKINYKQKEPNNSLITNSTGKMSIPMTSFQTTSSQSEDFNSHAEVECPSTATGNDCSKIVLISDHPDCLEDEKDAKEVTCHGSGGSTTAETTCDSSTSTDGDEVRICGIFMKPNSKKPEIEEVKNSEPADPLLKDAWSLCSTFQVSEKGAIYWPPLMLKGLLLDETMDPKFRSLFKMRVKDPEEEDSNDLVTRSEKESDVIDLLDCSKYVSDFIWANNCAGYLHCFDPQCEGSHCGMCFNVHCFRSGCLRQERGRGRLLGCVEACQSIIANGNPTVVKVYVQKLDDALYGWYYALESLKDYLAEFSYCWDSLDNSAKSQLKTLLTTVSIRKISAAKSQTSLQIPIYQRQKRMWPVVTPVEVYTRFGPPVRRTTASTLQYDVPCEKIEKDQLPAAVEEVNRSSSIAASLADVGAVSDPDEQLCLDRKLSPAEFVEGLILKVEKMRDEFMNMETNVIKICSEIVEQELNVDINNKKNLDDAHADALAGLRVSSPITSLEHLRLQEAKIVAGRRRLHRAENLIQLDCQHYIEPQSTASLERKMADAERTVGVIREARNKEKKQGAEDWQTMLSTLSPLMEDLNLNNEAKNFKCGVAAGVSRGIQTESQLQVVIKGGQTNVSGAGEAFYSETLSREGLLADSFLYSLRCEEPSDGNTVVVYPYAGLCLADLCHSMRGMKSSLSEDFIYRVIKDVLEGLGHWENVQISHRDIKLENCVVNSIDTSVDILSKELGLTKDKYGDFEKRISVKPRIIDLGSVTPFSVSNPLLWFTAGYTPPEFAVDRSKIDPFSLGSFMLCLARGPTFNPDPSKWTFELIEHELDQNAQLSPEFRDLVSKLMTLSFDDRPSLAEISLHPWFKKMEARSINKFSDQNSLQRNGVVSSQCWSLKRTEDILKGQTETHAYSPFAKKLNDCLVPLQPLARNVTG